VTGLLGALLRDIDAQLGGMQAIGAALDRIEVAADQLDSVSEDLRVLQEEGAAVASQAPGLLERLNRA
jgi:hypothetical protein